MKIAQALARIALQLHRQGSKQEAERVWQDAKGIYMRELVKQHTTKHTA
ncbi:hypothetical protein RCJ22_15635 [Vibrio sp. FNV 38]|nr:hypothetical protein [Vibrio sp. FNV 38]